MIDPKSRYSTVGTLFHTGADGVAVPYLARRIIPSIQNYVPLDRERLQGNERIDAIAERTLGDPLLYWRIVDANGDADPITAAQPAGRLLTIPLPLEIAKNGDS